MLDDKLEELSKEKSKQVHKLIRETLMGVLSALYESKIVKRVNMGKVMMIFGLKDSDLNDIWIDFEDEAFLAGYKAYKANEIAKVLKHSEKYRANMLPPADETIH